MRYAKAYPQPPILTAQGAPARRISAEQQLRRLAMACMLWEENYYSDGKSVAENIKECAAQVHPGELIQIIVEAKKDHKLRSIPLLLTRELLRHTDRGNTPVADIVGMVCTRPDMMVDLLAMYWEGKRTPLSNQLKKGLAKAFRRFDEYQLAKWNRAGSIKLRDVLFLCHAKPENEEQAALWKRLVEDKLATPDTWEVRLSGGEDKKESWQEMLENDKLGIVALLKNLRGMSEAGVPREAIANGILRAGARPHGVLPWQFMAALDAAPAFLNELNVVMLAGMVNMPKFLGKTVILVDNSGSMQTAISNRSVMKRSDAAAGIAIMAREMCADVRVFPFSDHITEIPAYQGFALRDAIQKGMRPASTLLGGAVHWLNSHVQYDRLIIISDEQSHDTIPNPPNGAKGYMINVACEKNGVGYGPWMHIDGFSEHTLRFIYELERENSQFAAE